ncbi:MAG: DinB family protein [Anaerolineae bacterium]|nr:DinB family protein [Anaerolineae bacterium]
MSVQKQAITTLIWLSDNVFDGDSAYALMANLSNLRDEDWDAVPAGGERSIADILEHVGWAKWMYQDNAFGPGTMQGDQPPLVPANGARTRPREELLTWLNEAHRAWIAALSALADDAELDRERPLAWGGTLPARNIIRIVIAHDVYHAGEINHIRALLQGNDHWT